MRLIVLLFLSCFFSSILAYSQQIDQTKIKSLISFSDSTLADEIIVYHKNRPVLHWKSSRCDTVYFNTASMVKSWNAIVIGRMINQGLISSENDLVCSYMPQWKVGCKNKITIKHLLTMSAGFDRKGGVGIISKDDMNTYVLSLEPDTIPDVKFSYSNESVQLLGLMIKNIAQMDLQTYYKDILFDPLGMDSTSLFKDPSGNYQVYGGATTTVQDAANIGLLMLNNGKVGDLQVVPTSWVNKMIRPSKNAAYYGYLWWLDNNSNHKNFAATGDYGQFTIAFPELDLLFLRKQ